VAGQETTSVASANVVRGHWRDRTVNWRAHGLGQLLYELAEPDALVRGIRELIQMDNPPGEPVVVHKAEAASWFSYRKKPKRGWLAEIHPGRPAVASRLSGLGLRGTSGSS
jgi:hypothetical protein